MFRFTRLGLVLLCAIVWLPPAWALRSRPSLELPTHVAPAAVTQCLTAGIARWQVPRRYIENVAEGPLRHSLRLSDPATGRTGFELIAEPGRVRLFEYGPKLSRQWLRLIRRCAGD